MKPILDFFAESYYTLPLMLVFQVIAAIVTYRRKRKFKQLKNFHWYPIASLSQSISSLVIVSFLDGNMEFKYLRVSVVVFVFLEVLLFYDFFSSVIKMSNLILILKVSFIAFLIYSTGIFVFTDTFSSGTIIAGETCIVLLAVCLYFMELFRLPPTVNIIDQPEFWINIGILFLFSCTLPSVVLAYFVKLYPLSDSYFYFINFIGYSVLFSFVIRGYLCRKEMQLPNNSKYTFS